MAKLGVNIDHVATVRQARQTYEPDPVWAAAVAELAGADCITVHLREDRRHIQDRDVRLLKETVQVKLNLEMATTPEITEIATTLRPHQATLVPEKREEVTTEGGLDVIGQREAVAQCIDALHEAGIEVSLFVDPDRRQIDLAKELEVAAIELHTGSYADAANEKVEQAELAELVSAAAHARELGLQLHMGHGLNYRNVIPIARIPGVGELNIGHSIVARAIFVGFEQAVREMKALISR